ncbi:MAG: hypothetical protein ACTSPI_17825, partial [Candidatus Heimdallarchaeaceae archaeon]
NDYNLFFVSGIKSIESEISEEERKRLLGKHQEIEEKIENVKELLLIQPLKLLNEKGRKLLEKGDQLYKTLIEKQSEESFYRFNNYEKEWKEWRKRSENALLREMEEEASDREKDLLNKEKDELEEILAQNESKYREIKRAKGFVDVLSSYTEIPLVELQQKLDFAELQDLEMWLLELSSVLSLRIDRDKLIIPEKATREITQSIDELIKKFAEWERTGEGKKI